ncbi:MAG: menaquinone biosynthesis decarboxylase, partial [Bacteroidales bacterium]|nr:menaquinone biosynthesis decarboxylase [Bacteroidales bacterium]
PRFHITCITHRKEAIYPATIVGIPPMEDAWIGKATERIFLAPMRTAIALEILDMVMPSEGVFHNIVLVKIKKSYPGQGQKVMNALWGAGQMMFTKTILIFDENIDLNNPLKHLGNLLNKINPEQDLSIFQGPLDVLDHAGNKPSFGGKLGIDLTSKFIDEPGYTSSLSDNEIPALEDVQNKLRSFNDIIDFNYLINLGLPILLLSVHKNQKKQISSLFHELCNNQFLVE